MNEPPNRRRARNPLRPDDTPPPTPQGEPGHGGAGVTGGHAQIFPEKRLLPQPPPFDSFPTPEAYGEAIVQLCVRVAQGVIEHDVASAVRPFVERAKAEFPTMYAEAWARYDEALSEYLGNPPAGRWPKIENLQGLDREVELLLWNIAAGLNVETLPGIRESAAWREIKRRESTDPAFCKRMGNIKAGAATRAKTVATGAEEDDNRAEALVLNWWRLGAWLMDERSGVYAFRAASCGRFFPVYQPQARSTRAEQREQAERVELQERKWRETFKAQAAKLKLPRCASLGQKALVRVSFDGEFVSAGAWAGTGN